MTARCPTAIFDDLTTLSDSTRSRMLLLLERHELTVSELCAVLQLPQSTVSRHLKTLADASWVSRAATARAATTRWRSTSADAHDAAAVVAACASRSAPPPAPIRTRAG